MPAPNRTVLHGVMTSVPVFADIAKGAMNHNSRVYVDQFRNEWIYDENDNVWWPDGRVSFEYDFDEEGGVAGDITLDEYIPANFIVTHGVIEMVEPMTSGGAATVALRLVDTEDILAAAAFNGFTDLHAVVPDVITAGTFIKPDSEAHMVMTIAVADLTAGKFVVHLFGFPGQPAALIFSSSSSSMTSSSSSESSSSTSSTSSSSASSTSSSSNSSSSSVTSSSSTSSNSSSSTSSNSSSSTSSNSSSSVAFSSSSSSEISTSEGFSTSSQSSSSQSSSSTSQG